MEVASVYQEAKEATQLAPQDLTETLISTLPNDPTKANLAYGHRTIPKLVQLAYLGIGNGFIETH